MTPIEKSVLHCGFCTVCRSTCEAPKLSYYNHYDNEVMKVCSEKCREIFVETCIKFYTKSEKKS